MNPNLLSSLSALAAAGLSAAGAHTVLQRHRGRLRRLAGPGGGMPIGAAGASAQATPRTSSSLMALVRAAARRGERERKRRLVAAEVPFLLDLLVICADGGLNLHQGLVTASDLVAGPLGEGLFRLRRDLDMGRPLPGALDALARALDTEEVRSVVRIVKIGQALGTPVGESLRNASRYLRHRLRLATEQRLAAMPLKLTLCTLAFFMPPIFVLLLLPNVLNFAGSRW